MLQGTAHVYCIAMLPGSISTDLSVKALHAMLTKIDKDKLWVNPDCGLKTRGVPETDASLRNMVAAAKQIREEV